MTTDTNLPDAVKAGGMSGAQAATVRGVIIGLCVVAMLLVFQPFSQWLFGLGAVLVVFGGLAFNLVPLARRGVRAASLVRSGIIVLVSLFVVLGLAIGSAYLYGIYLQSLQAG